MGVGLFDVVVPKNMVIQGNIRLGILFRAMQIAAMGIGIWQITGARAWWKVISPTFAGKSVWSELGAKDDDVKHCTDLGAYEYAWSASYVFKPTRCKRVDNYLNHILQGDGSLTAITHVSEKTTVESFGDACNPGKEASCTSSGGVYTVEVEDGSCTCKSAEEYVVQNADATMVYFIHGYDVYDASIKLTGSSAKTEADLQNVATGDTQALSGGIRTRFFDTAGKPCTFGGKTEWLPEESLAGIGGSIAELLACAGASLDDEVPELRSFLASESGMPTRRITGSFLQLSMFYENKDQHGEGHYDVVASVRPRVFAQWTIANLISPTFGFSTDSMGNETIRTYRANRHGIEISMTASGAMVYFDAFALLTAILGMVVLLNIPTKIIQVIAYNCIGFESMVYRHAAKEPCSFRKQICGSMLRRCTYKAAYNLFMKHQGLKGLHEEDHRMGARDFRDVIASLFDWVVEDGLLDATDVSGVSEFVYETMKRDFAINNDRSLASVCSATWQRACASNETLTLREIAQCFKLDRMRCIGERLLSSASLSHKHLVEQSEPLSLQAPPDSEKQVLAAALQEIAQLKERIQSLEEDGPRNNGAEDDGEVHLDMVPMPSSQAEPLFDASEFDGASASRDWKEMVAVQKFKQEKLENKNESWRMSTEFQLNRRLQAMEERLSAAGK